MNFKFQHDVWRLLRRNLSTGQIVGYIVANIVGLTILLVGLLFYCDSRHTSTPDDRFISNNYCVLSKRVEGIGLRPCGFSEAEIADLAAQPWAIKVGRFTSSRFAVSGSVSMGGRGLSSYMFFESVPDEFFDIKPTGWHFTPGDDYIPIVLSRDYLALYNFGFAIPQGLPQVSEEVVEAIPLTLQLTGADLRTDTYRGGIVGFSSRLNTIVVPQSFMDWANARYAPTPSDSTSQSGGRISSATPTFAASRLIVEVDRLAERAMTDYYRAHDIEVAGAQSDNSKLAGFLTVVAAVVSAGGVVISLLSMFILLLSIFLLLQKNRDKLRGLMLLGYHPTGVARYYELPVTLTNGLITLVSLGLTLLCRTLWLPALAELGLGGASLMPVLLFAAAYLLLVTVFDIAVVRTRVRRIFAN